MWAYMPLYSVGAAIKALNTQIRLAHNGNQTRGANLSAEKQ